MLSWPLGAETFTVAYKPAVQLLRARGGLPFFIGAVGECSLRCLSESFSEPTCGRGLGAGRLGLALPQPAHALLVPVRDDRLDRLWLEGGVVAGCVERAPVTLGEVVQRHVGRVHPLI